MELRPREQLASATMIATHALLTHLEKSRSALESLVTDMRDFACLVTREGQILWGNDQAARWVGCHRDRLHQATIEGLFSPGDNELFLLQLQSVESDARQDIECLLPVQQGGNARDVLWSLRPFRAISARRGLLILIVGRDMTEILRERAARGRLESELETAQLMQEAFLPAPNLQNERLNIAASYIAAEKCSGDWWGHFDLGSGLDLVCIADVSGHGTASALVTAMTQAVCMNFAQRVRQLPQEKASLHPKALCEQLHTVIRGTFHGRCLMTFFVLLFDGPGQRVHVCNAGHNFPYLQRAGSQPLETLPILVSGNPLGAEDSCACGESSLAIGAGDRIVLYTDGVIEGRNRQRKAYGTGGLKRSLSRHQALATAACRDSLVTDVMTHMGLGVLRDDITLVVIDLKPVSV